MRDYTDVQRVAMYLKSETICVRDYTGTQRVAMYKINATESRDVIGGEPERAPH